MAIGIFDSGLGGLSVLHRLLQTMPETSFVYLGDNANAPYGTRAPDDILQRTQQATQFLWDNGCDLVILACNTASAIALRPMQTAGVPEGKRVLGVFVPMIEALSGRSWGDTRPPVTSAIQRVTLFATPATVASGAFERELNLRATGIDVTAIACHDLVDAIEAQASDKIEQLVRKYVGLANSQQPDPQAAVLGCTHYPLVADSFREHLGLGVQIFSQPDLVSDALIDYVGRHPELSGTGQAGYWTTGDPATVSNAATQFAGRTIRFQPCSL